MIERKDDAECSHSTKGKSSQIFQSTADSRVLSEEKNSSYWPRAVSTARNCAGRNSIVYWVTSIPSIQVDCQQTTLTRCFQDKVHCYIRRPAQVDVNTRWITSDEVIDPALSKTCQLDPAPTRICADCYHRLWLCYITNRCLERCCMFSCILWHNFKITNV